MPLLSDAQIAQYRKDGFLLIKGAFPPERVAALREAIKDAPPVSAELFDVPGLKHFWRDPVIVEAAKQLLGGPITFFGEASTSRIEMRPRQHVDGRHIHHDAKGTPENLFNRVHAPAEEPYPVIRFGVYLQDFKHHSGGLKVVPGSHAIDSSHFVESELTYFNVPSEPGDLVCFCQKTLHSPYGMRLKDAPTLGLSPAEEDELSIVGGEDFLPPPEGRDVIFIDYAGRGLLADLHIKGRALHPMNRKTSLIRALDDVQFEEHTRALGIDLRMDLAVVEAARGVAAHLSGSSIAPEGMPYFKAFARLCRLSRESTPVHSLFTFPEDESVEATNRALTEVLARVRQVPEIASGMTEDPAMKGRKLKIKLKSSAPAP